jgi:hypothetical protein
MPTVKLGDLEAALMFVSSGSPNENNAYISRATGEIFWESEDLGIDDQELPADLGNPDDYIAVPHKTELELGKRLILRFVDREIPDEYDEVENIFRHKGGYSRYKALLERKNKLEAWHKYEEDETKAALRDWSEDEGAVVVESPDEPTA